LSMSPSPHNFGPWTIIAHWLTVVPVEMTKRGRQSYPWAFILIAVMGILGGCSTASDVPLRTILSVPVTQGLEITQKDEPKSYMIAPGDALTVRFFYNPQLDEDVQVRPDGKISLSLIGELDASGETPGYLSREITRTYARYLVHPNAVVIMRRFADARAFIGGNVNHTGIVDMSQGRVSVLQGIAVAGGVTDVATLKDVILVRRLPDQMQPLIMDLDLVDALNGTNPEQDVMLMPNDEVYVPRSEMASTNLALHQLIWNNLNLSTYGGFTGTKIVQ
jgi:protein involved in polysaccharide export with SLBB domain